ncbi:PSD1 and planctomycete cytochrome C domain-containing protein [Planctomicrobium sp. SH668]|uniref:PSD1 and planctomycete cytochrome C domain-containing protein n=1 Tax=Planctomicrobium sp. SH668 TaxID=3448126 RepID=UPI003F5C693F
MSRRLNLRRNERVRGRGRFQLAMRQASLTATIIFCMGTYTPNASAEVSFGKQIRPLLAEHCLNCHGPDEQRREAGLRLDQEASSKMSAIVAHKPDESELVKRITSTDPDLLMPPAEHGKSLTEAEIELLRKWIAEGANFEDHWAFEPIQKPSVPKTKSAASTDIDRFIVAQLEAQGLELSPRISREKLIRRATFDLIGLPPSWDEVKAFVEDSSPNALEKVIDRLLEAPQYGERWGRHWLDIARYADTHGGSAVGFTKFPFSYTYRDYVIKSMNADVPYNQFIVEQLAADQLGLPENDPSLAGLGFLTVGMQYRSVHDLIDDQIDVVSRGLLGLTVACARCHDHKFDSIPTTDYYAMYATLASSHSVDLLPLIGTPSPTEQYNAYERELAKRQVAYEDMARDQTEVMRSRVRMQVGLYLIELAKGTPEQDLSAAFLSYRTDDVRPPLLNRWRDYMAKMPADDPVFGPWVQLFNVDTAEFATRCGELIASMKAANSESKINEQSLGIQPPPWNPRVIDAIEKRQPQSLIELAEAYGKLFADLHQSWLKSQLETSLEAAVGGTILPDEDPGHSEINSVIARQLRRHLYQPDTPTAMPDDVAVKMLNRTVSDTLGGRRGAIHDLHLNSPGSPPRAMAIEESKSPPSFAVFLRGNPLSRGETVPARFLTALSGQDVTPFRDGERRLGLARAIVDPENPLTRRVVVNWIWQNHFNQGLVSTPDDFGTRGTPPTHPELLDYLASTFAEDGWSIKKLHKRIMLSDVYQQGAIENPDSRNKDPLNDLVWRMPRRRLEMEAMRDSMLAVSGELDLTQGGRPVELNEEPVSPRRSVYGFINRDIVSSLSSTFDGANPITCTAKRPDTNVPQQALYVLNSAFIQDRAVKLAERAQAAAIDADERIRWIYRSVLSRDPDAEELRVAGSFVESNQPAVNEPENIGAPEESRTVATVNPWSQLAHALLASNEFIFLD